MTVSSGSVFLCCEHKVSVSSLRVMVRWGDFTSADNLHTASSDWIFFSVWMCSLVYILWGNYDPWICRDVEKRKRIFPVIRPFLSASVHRRNEWWSLCGRRGATSYLGGIKLNFSTCDSAWSEGGQSKGKLVALLQSCVTLSALICKLLWLVSSQEKST